jgi:hypothetical protein
MPRRLTKRCDVTRQIRTSVAIKPLNLLDLAAEIDVVAHLSRHHLSNLARISQSLRYSLGTENNGRKLFSTSSITRTAKLKHAII